MHMYIRIILLNTRMHEGWYLVIGVVDLAAFAYYLSFRNHIHISSS